ncbi:MAG: hypothetical protein HC784_04350 [Hydrococcus sp. CSU_1_8]|nr:hypothetical protein [Hydrococcus sp. CSU_1_8]
MKSELTEQSFGFVEMLNTLLTQLFMDTLRLMTPNNNSNPVESHPFIKPMFLGRSHRTIININLACQMWLK